MSLAMTTTDRPLLGRRGSGLAIWCLRAVALGGVLLAIVLPVHGLTMHGGSVPVSLAPGKVPPLDLPHLPLGVTLSTAADAMSLDVARLPIAHVNFAALLLALVVLGAAEAFRRGAALADDVEGLI
jgi:hypothetical protein